MGSYPLLSLAPTHVEVELGCDNEDWRVNVTETWSGMEFVNVAQHKIGHSLGLSNSPVGDSVMYPYYKGKQGTQEVMMMS